MTLVALTFEKGSLILVEYTASLKDDGTVVDTTDKIKAEAHSIYDANEKYGPKLVSIDEINYPVYAKFGEELAKLSVGEQQIIELKPEETWGVRDPKKIRMYSIRKLGKDAEQYSIGDTVEVDKKSGIIRFMGSGRVQIDFNHKYAGKIVLYDVIVKAHLETPEEIIDAVLDARFDSTATSYKMNSDDTLSIPIPDEMFASPNLSTAKRHVVRDLFKFLSHLESIQFTEMHINKSKTSSTQSSGDTTTVASGTDSVNDDDNNRNDDDKSDNNNDNNNRTASLDKKLDELLSDDD